MNPAHKPTKRKGKRERLPTLPKLERKLWSLFSPYIRLRDSLATTGTKTECVCIHCQRRVPYSQIQAGHFITRREKSVKYDERNVNGECARCNHFVKDKFWYEVNLRRKIGDARLSALKLHAEEIRIKQFKRYEIEELIEVYTRELEEITKCCYPT